MGLVRAGRGSEVEGVYVGRSTGPGGIQSKWANPYKISAAYDRTRVITLFKKLVESDPAKYSAEELRGKVLLCHCRENQDCHADVLCDLANKAPAAKDHFQGNVEGDPVMTDFIDDGLPVRPQEARASSTP